ncbi:hypothetical protein FrEUN1fDRAFT_5692, partial [Parafrankia sp. EUN1f]
MRSLSPIAAAIAMLVPDKICQAPEVFGRVISPLTMRPSATRIAVALPASEAVRPVMSDCGWVWLAAALPA